MAARQCVSILAAALLAALCAGCRGKAPAGPASGGGTIQTKVMHVDGLPPWDADAWGDEEPPDFDEPNEADNAAEKGRALLAEGRFAEARAAYGRYTGWMEVDLRKLAQNAARKRRYADAFALYRMLLGFRECILWPQLCSSWVDEDSEYLAVIGKTPADRLDDAAVMDLGASEPYGRLKALINSRDFEDADVRRELFEIADAYLLKYPKARLGVTAIIAASTAALSEESPKGESRARGIRVTDDLLGRMRAAGYPRHSLDVVLMNLACWAEYAEGDNEILIRARKASEEIGRDGEPQFRADWLLAAADYALRAREDNGLLSRRLYAEALSLHPEPPWGNTARNGIITTWLATDGPDAALAALREIENASPAGTDVSPCLFLIAASHRETKQPDRAVAVLDEVSRRHADTPTAAAAFKAMGDVYADAGNDAKMLAAYERAAALLPPDRPLGSRDSSLRSSVCERLADYHVENGHWSEGLRWAKTWKPWSWAGEIRESRLKQRRRHIALCEAALGMADEALKSMERLEDADLPRPAMKLVDSFCEHGRLDELMPKLEAAAKEPDGEGARVALHYVSLLGLRSRRDVGALWKAMDAEGLSSERQAWLREVVPALVAEIGEPAKPFLLAELRRKGGRSDQAEIALARMKDPETLQVLMARAKTETGEYALQKTLTALALSGTVDAWALIGQYADNGTEAQTWAARDVLREHPRPKGAPDGAETD